MADTFHQKEIIVLMFPNIIKTQLFSHNKTKFLTKQKII